MSYRCATRGLTLFGLPDGEPRLVCDGCGATRTAIKRSGMPYAWLLDNKRAPGWAFEKTSEYTRRDWCAECDIKRKKEVPT